MPAPARNFMIIYSGREGSSAIISTLSAQPELNVPIFEDLDPHGLGEGYSVDRAMMLLDRVYATGRNPLGGPDDACLFPKDDAGRAAAQSIGVKYRAPPDRAALIAVLKKHDVQPFLLIRPDIVEATASQFISEMSAEGHGDVAGLFPQFRKFDLGQDEWASFKTAWNGRRHIARTRMIRHILRLRRLAMIDRAALTAELRRHGLRPLSLISADYVNDPARFVARVLTSLRVTPQGPPVTACKFEKVNDVPARSRVDRLWLSLMHPNSIRSILRIFAAHAQIRARAPAVRS